MPKPTRVPTYRHFKLRNLACVVLDGKTFYLGPYGSPESRVRYAAKIAEWGRNRSVAIADRDNPDAYTCGQLALDYLEYAEGYYVKNGQTTSQVFQIKLALKELVKLFETEPTAKFGPVKLKNLQQYLVDQGKSRSYLNKLVSCLKLAFKWAASEELIPAATHHGLQTVGGLKKGRTPAREIPPVEPVDEAIVEQTLPYLSPVVADMVRLQLGSAMRPGEVCNVRPCDITRGTDGTWVYRPEHHKTEHHNVDRIVTLGPLAQEILAPYLTGRDADAFCFSPAESQRQHYEAKRQKRKSPLTPSQQAQNGKPNLAGRHGTSSSQTATGGQSSAPASWRLPCPMNCESRPGPRKGSPRPRPTNSGATAKPGPALAQGSYVVSESVAAYTGHAHPSRLRRRRRPGRAGTPPH